MGGKRTSGRSNSGKEMHSRISSADSTKSFSLDSPSGHGRKNLSTEELPEFHQRKSSFDIISLLVSHEDNPSSTKTSRNGERDHFTYDQTEDSSGLPSFWHLVQPETTNREIFHRQHPLKKEVKGHPQQSVTNKRNTSANPMAYAPGGRKLGDVNRRLKRRKMKKVQSAKVGGFKALESSPNRSQRQGEEWLRVLADDNEEDDDDDEEDELIKRYFSGLSSAGSSISWAEDAMESEFTNQLRKLWDDIEMVCRGGSRPKEMSDAVHDECLEWRRAFPNPDLHRFSSCRNEDAEVSPAESPTLDEERGEGDAQFSSLVHSSRFEMGRKDFDDKVDLLQASFRSLHCTTPRPNIEKSTEYVSAWLSECQNSYVPDGDRTLPDYNCSRPSTPSTSVRNNTSMQQLSNEIDSRGKSMRIVSDVARSSCAHYSKSHAKFVAEPDPQNFFTSLAITSNENGYGSYPSRNDGGIPNSTEEMHPSGSYLFSYQSRIKESDEEEDDDTTSPSSPPDIISFRPNVRVQRPISSRIRDHTITPIATGSYAHSSAFHGRHHGVNLNRQQAATTNSRSNSLPQSQGTGLGGRIGIFDNSYVSIPTSATAEARTRRIHSGLTKPAQSIQQYGRSRQSLVSSIGQQQQAPWSRHTGDDLVMESNYVTSLYENYQTGGGSTETINVGGRTNNALSMRSNELVRSPTSPKDSLIKFQRSPTDDGSISIPECEDRTFKPTVSWLMNRVSPH